MISVNVLHQLGMRVCKQAHIGKSAALLREYRNTPGLSEMQIYEIDTAISGLEHAPLSRSTLITMIEEKEDG